MSLSTRVSLVGERLGSNKNYYLSANQFQLKEDTPSDIDCKKEKKNYGVCERERERDCRAVCEK